MTTDTTLIEKREELKRRLAAGEYKTLVDVLLGWFDRLLRKITRRSNPLSIWYITFILILAMILLGPISLIVTNDFAWVQYFLYQAKLTNQINILYFSTIIILPIASTAVIKQYIDRILAFCRNDLLDATQSTISLDRIAFWLNILCNRRLNFIVVVLGGSLGGLYLLSLLPMSGNPSYSITSFIIIYNLFNWNIIYLLLMAIFFSATLRLHDLKLFSSDPASSELITRLSEVLSFAVYFVAVVAALFTLAFTLIGTLLPYSGILLIFYLLPLLVLFILNQTSLASIIRRAKWKTLNEVQDKIEKLRASKNFGTSKTMDAINKLMDFHDRVKATRNSAIDSSTILNFINSLLLPLIAFLLGNLDKVLLLFSKKP